MSQQDDLNPIYAPATLEFVTVAAEYCAYLEQSEGRDRRALIGTMLKILPLLYLKAQLLPRVESQGDFLPRECVTEADYNWIRSLAHDVLTPGDEYEVLGGDGGETLWHTVSENLADIYQSLRNFVQAYRMGVEDSMTDALWLVWDEFEIFWGACALSAMGRLHTLMYGTEQDIDEDTL